MGSKKKLERISKLLDTKILYEAKDDELSMTYAESYPIFIEYFKKSQPLTKEHLIIGSQFIYGWMPTTLRYKSTNFDDVVKLLNKARKEIYLEKKEIEIIVKLMNKSITGTSKLLHFVNPDKYAIIDSKIYGYIKNNTNATTPPNVEAYMDYMKELKELIKNNRKQVDELKEKIQKANKSSAISDYRAVEAYLFFKSNNHFSKEKGIKP